MPVVKRPWTLCHKSPSHRATYVSLSQTVPHVASLCHMPRHWATCRITGPHVASLGHMPRHCATCCVTVPHVASLGHMSRHCSEAPNTLNTSIIQHQSMQECLIWRSPAVPFPSLCLWSSLESSWSRSSFPASPAWVPASAVCPLSLCP